ncbi:Transcription factor TFIIIC [Forsythia ovata]|uniref:Transcription factor TFIIIC n=1 Tax=Forsythia ovata TaxID=205694 RepID=A0ABD1S5A0_9LAMI
MEVDKESEGLDDEEEEEYVLIDLDSVYADIDIPPNAPYVLSGLDTLNPILVIDNKIKLIGEYEETIGTCLVFNESDAVPVLHEETGSSEANLFSGKCIVDPKSPGKQVNPIASLHKVLKFRLFSEAGIESTDNQTDKPS